MRWWLIECGGDSGLFWASKTYVDALEETTVNTHTALTRDQALFRGFTNVIAFNAHNPMRRHYYYCSFLSFFKQLRKLNQERWS